MEEGRPSEKDESNKNVDPEKLRFYRGVQIEDLFKENGRMMYVVNRKGNLSTLSSQAVRKQYPLNLIYYLESRVHLMNSLPFESVLKYSKQLLPTEK